MVDARREDRCIHNGDGRYFAKAFAEEREEAQPPLCRWTSVVLGGYGRITGTICPRPHKLRQNSGIFIGRRGSYQGKDMAMQRSTAQLVAAAQAGSLDAMDEIIHRHQDRVYALAYARLGNHHMAEDVAQATFVQALMSLGSIRKPQSLPAWLCKVAVSQCARLVRSNRRSPRPDLGLFTKH